MNLDRLQQRADIWRVGQASPANSPGIPTGYATLDELLPAGGWPVGGLTEILADHTGTGALHLIMPALARLSQQKRWIVLVAPPYIPYAPALANLGVDLSHLIMVHPRAHRDTLWAVEQALRSPTCSAVLAWLADTAHATALRRLQLASEAGQTWGVLFRNRGAATQPSPAATRVDVTGSEQGVQVQLLKRRGGWPTGPVHLSRDDALVGPVFSQSAAGGLHSGSTASSDPQGTLLPV